MFNIKVWDFMTLWCLRKDIFNTDGYSKCLSEIKEFQKVSKSLRKWCSGFRIVKIEGDAQNTEKTWDEEK